jgi:hypothetical protein
MARGGGGLSYEYQSIFKSSTFPPIFYFFDPHLPGIRLIRIRALVIGEAGPDLFSEYFKNLNIFLLRPP